MGTLLQDIKYGIRQLYMSPCFTICTILVLSLGIAACTAFFSAWDGIRDWSLPFDRSDRLVSIWSKSRNPRHSHFPRLNCSFPDYQDFVAQNTVFETLAAQGYRTMNLTGRDEPLALTGWAITDNLFEVFRKQPVLGRSFLPEEISAEQSQVVILSHALWQQAFSQDPDILGQDVTLDNRVYNVVGIAHPDMDYRQGFSAQFYIPLTSSPSESRSRHALQVFGRLHPTVTLQAATAEMKTIAARLEAQYPESNKDFTVLLIPLQELLFGKVQGTVVTMMAAAVLLLLVASTNIANLFLSRMDRRSQEMAVRSAIGAGRWQLSRLVLIESLLISLVSGLIGFVGATGSMGLMRRGMNLITSSGGMAGIPRITINPGILFFTLGLSIIVTLCFGLLPAWKTSQTSPLQSLRTKARGSSRSRHGRHLAHVLVTAQIALAVVLLVGAGLLVKSLIQLRLSSPGFNPVNLMTLQITLPQSRAYETDRQRADFCRAVLTQLQNIPGVSHVAATNIIPVSDFNFMRGFQILDRTSQSPDDSMAAEFRTVSTDYFTTLGMPLIKGRLFQETDAGNLHVVIVDEEFVRRYFPNQDPIGQRIALGAPCEIIGVVGNHQTGTRINEQTFPHMYRPLRQACMERIVFIARTQTDPLTLAESMRRAVWAVDVKQPINHIQPMQGIIHDTRATYRLSSFVLNLFAGGALILITVGLYGVTASTITQRTREIGIRKAFGACHVDIIKSIIGTGLILTGLGITVGLIVALVVCRLMGSLLYNTNPTDPISYSIVISFVGVVSLLACYIPARRAAKIDPMAALRYE
ncbi:MAG: ABC transporter permease [Sedimentisphaerales bacterium]|nr:ABC transporter permease [Sedimentisphaerales bacterium]